MHTRNASTGTTSKHTKASHLLATDLTILYTNIDTITSKKQKLTAKIAETSAKIVAVVEVKPKNCRYALSQTELELDSFELYSNLNKTGRGVCIYVHQSLHAKNFTLNIDLLKDTKFVEITFKNSKSLVIGVAYRSPNAESAHNQALNDLFDGLYSTTKHIILLGDLNYPEIDWAALKSNSSENHPATGFCMLAVMHHWFKR